MNTMLNLGRTNTSLVMGALLIAALAAQFRKDCYRPRIYWVSVIVTLALVIVMTRAQRHATAGSSTAATRR